MFKFQMDQVYVGSHTHSTNSWKSRHDFYTAFSLLLSPLQHNSQLYKHLEPIFTGPWEWKELSHRGPPFLFSSLEEREKEVRRCGWCTLFILDKVQTKRKKKRNKNIYIYMDNQKLFNRRELIIYFWVKTLMGITHKNLYYRLENPEKFIQKSWAILECRAAGNLYCAVNLCSAACNISGHFHCILQQKHLILFPHSDNLFIY